MFRIHYDIQINKVGAIPKKNCKIEWLDRFDEESDRKIELASDFIEKTMVKNDELKEETFTFHAVSYRTIGLTHGEFIWALARLGYTLKQQNELSWGCYVNIDFDEFMIRFKEYCLKNNIK